MWTSLKVSFFNQLLKISTWDIDSKQNFFLVFSINSKLNYVLYWWKIMSCTFQTTSMKTSSSYVILLLLFSSFGFINFCIFKGFCSYLVHFSLAFIYCYFTAQLFLFLILIVLCLFQEFYGLVSVSIRWYITFFFLFSVIFSV